MAKADIIVGINPIAQLLETNPERVLEIFVSVSNKRIDQLVQLAKEQQIAVHKADNKNLDKYGTNHQGIAAKILANKSYSEHDLEDLIKSAAKPLILILDGVQDPHNFGACLRTADAAGVTAVIIPKDNAVGITPVVRKVASGAAETMPIIQVTNLARTMRQLQELGVWIVGTAGDGADVLYDLDLSGSIGIVMGAEEKGLRDLTKKHCDFVAKIPLHGSVESLNVSVATGVCLFEVTRQRRR